MDALEFAVDYTTLFDVLTLIVVLSFFVERALSVVFESSLFIGWYNPGTKKKPAPATEAEGEGQAPTTKPKKKGIKELIAIIVSIVVVYNIGFNALAIVTKNPHVSPELGYFITGLIIAGGSKASLKLFGEVLDFRSDAERRRKEYEKNNPQTS
ncbi:hypothetical protein [Pseudotenacibaculum haliotis]|uniref:Holin n=1 Tax=Pseudotenacibaculum haliotis TaxID=1862138 RepID=A0ABW5LUC8_9FLAO